MADSFVPDSSFGLPTCDFAVIYQDGRTRRADSLISVRPLPFGGGAVVQSGGLGPRYWTLKVYADATGVQHLEAARGYHGVLHTIEGDEDCTLMNSDSGPWYVTDSAGATQPQEVTVAFVLDS